MALRFPVHSAPAAAAQARMAFDAALASPSSQFPSSQSPSSRPFQLFDPEPERWSESAPPPMDVGEDAAELPPEPRFSDLYALFRRKRLVEKARPPREVEAMDETARHFQRACGDPLLRELCESTLERFAAWLAAREWRGKPIAGTTQAKHLRHLSTLLHYAGPRQARGLKARKTAARAGLIVVPCLCEDEWPLEDPGKKGTLTAAEMTAWLASLTGLEHPRLALLTPRTWLTALIVWSYNTGLRIESTLAARWAWLDGDWLRVPKEHYKGKKRHHVCYLNRWAREAAEKVRTPDGRIFSWPYSQNWCAHCVAESAPGPAYRLHRLRATLSTNCISRGHEMVAQMQLGHKGGVTQESYAHFRRIAPEVLEDEQVLPQPVIASWGGVRQQVFSMLLDDPDDPAPRDLEGQQQLFS